MRKCWQAKATALAPLLNTEMGYPNNVLRTISTGICLPHKFFNHFKKKT